MIDFKNYERLTISKGEIRFYEDAYNKCSNHNAPEIREKINSGALVCDINEYQSCSYTTKELKDIYTRLSQLEDMIEQGKLVDKIEPKIEMTKEQQIEKMAKVIDERLLEANLVLGSMNKGKGYWIAEDLINKGYRKKEEIEKQVAK